MTILNFFSQKISRQGCSWFPKFLQLSCLKPKYTLRRQLVMGYGITAFMTIFIVVSMATIAAQRAGSKVRDESMELFQTQLDVILQESGVFTGDILDKKMNGLRGSVNLLTEIVRDRIVGYPNDGWENDIHVPFVDRETGRRFYPLKANLLPQDFRIISNIDPNNTANLSENLQERGDIGDYQMQLLTNWNTESAMFNFQGNCDPRITDPKELGYYPFCTEDNNDASLGGKIKFPTTTLAPLEQKAADIGVFTKAIFEAQPLAHSLGVWFVNSGAGAGVTFPSFAAIKGLEYTSEGCEWMRETNPYTGRPLGTEEEINRCAPAGTRSTIRDYNGLERPWCADQALHPGETRIFGPYKGTTFLTWRVTIGRAVFDRKTNELIACTHLDLSIVQAEKLLDDITKDLPSNTVVIKPDGTVVVGATQTDADGNTVNYTPKLWETDFIDIETYRKLTDSISFWEDEWDIESAQNKYNFSVKSKDTYFTVFPSPIPPDMYDPLYRPEFLIFSSIDTKTQDETIDRIDGIISADINDAIILSVAFGAIGLCCMMTVITIVAQVLTKPLKWMEDKAQEIVYHTDKEEGDSLIVANEDDSEIHFCSFMPKTEIHELVSEFRSMISGFSGEGASTVAFPRHTETKNLVTWKEDFRKFYNLSPNLEHRLKEEMNMMTRSVSRRMSKKSAMRAGSMRRSSIRRSSTRRPSTRRSSNWGSSSGRNLSGKNSVGFRNSSSFPLSNSDFEQILAAADEEGEDDGSAIINKQIMRDSSPIFLSTQMGGGSTTDSRTASWKSSAILSAKSSELPKYDFDRFPRPPTRINIGSNIQHREDIRRLSFKEKKRTEEQIIHILRSPLYWKVLCCIVIPLLAAIIATMTLVGSQLTNKFPKWINEASSASFALEVQHLNTSTGLIKKHVEEIFEGPLQDLHTIHRMSGWLLFGAVNRSDGFTDIEMEMTEECKSYENLSACPFEKSDTRSPCPCEWNDPWERTCNKTRNSTLLGDPRYLQKLWYLNQVRTANQTYPNGSYDSKSTSWYTDPDEMPGSDKGSDADGHSTAYDRVRVASALSTIIFPVYNYGIEVRADGSAASAMSGYISFDTDGAYGGFSGCNYDAAGYAHFISSDANGAYNISEYCPKGKFGYDPRCRGWYDNTKRGGLESDDGVYITPPYRFATDDDVGNTAASPLIDPNSGEFVGNTLIDFKTSDIAKVVDKSNFELYAVILPTATDREYVIHSSELDDESTPKPIDEVLARHDPPGTSNHDRFEEILEGMGNKGSGEKCNFYRTDENGAQHEFCYAYKPIFITELRPVQPDDYSRGALHSTKFLYSIIMFQDVKDITSEFMKRSDDIDRLLQQTYIIYMVITSLTALIFIIVVATISLHVTRPMIQLLRTVKQVNEGGIDDDMPPLTGGSREVHRVYASFAKLYKTVRMSNSAFFVGDLSLAHHIALDALRLFRKIGDQKAIAISCNNIGNTLLAWMVECREPGTSLELEGDDCAYCTEAAIKYYTEAVTYGTKGFEEATGDAEKAVFAQQLADRHFNRAMCLLLTTDDPCASIDAKETALDDLYLVKQYDQGVKEYMLHSKTLLENSDVIFERSLRRLHGLAALIDIEPDVWDVWDIYELVDQADLMLQAAWNQDEAPLFHNMTKIGRLQELEGAVTGIELSSGKADDAVEMATRMLIEDEFLLDSSFIEAADCILLSSRENREAEDDQTEEEEQQEKAFQDESITGLKQEFKRMRKPGMRNALDIGRAFVFCIDIKGEWNGQALLLDLRKSILEFYEDNFQPNDTVGIVTFDPKDGTLQKVQPSSAKDLLASSSTDNHQYPHRDALVGATTGVACSRFTPALQGGIDMALEVESSSASDVCLLYVSDGGAYDETIYSRLQHRIEASSRSGNAHIRASSRSISVASSIDLVVIDLLASEEDLTNRSSTMFPSPRQLAHQHTSFKERPPPTPTLSFEESCKSLVTATRSRASVYIRADVDKLDESFRKATASINEGTSFAGNQLQRALTMQKF